MMCPPQPAVPSPPTTSRSTQVLKSTSLASFLGTAVEICLATPSHIDTINTLLALGIGPWKVYTFTPSNTTAQTYRGRPAKFALKVAFASMGSMTWEIMQPLPLSTTTATSIESESSDPSTQQGQDIISDFLQTHPKGGVHHVAFDCNNIPWEDRMAGFEARGLKPVMSGRWMDGNAFAFFETEAGAEPLTFETYMFPPDWEFPPADAVYSVEDPPKTREEEKTLSSSALSKLSSAKGFPKSSLSGARLPSLQPPSQAELGVIHTLAARTGIAVPLLANQTVTIINTHGTQVVDFWAFTTTSTPKSTRASTSTSGSTSTIASHLSLSHTRASTLRLSPLAGDVLVSNQRTPLLRFEEDTSPHGVHDTLIAACDKNRYRQLLGDGTQEAEEHASCAENLKTALRELGVVVPGDGDGVGVDEGLGVGVGVGGGGGGAEGRRGRGHSSWSVPDPLNLWMNIPIAPRTTRDLSFSAPTSRSGDRVVLRALTDCVVAMSACPQDLVPVNGVGMTPRDVEWV